MSLLAELKRRNVLRVIAAYIAVAWLIIQVVETLFPMFGFSDDAARTVVIMLAIGLLPAVVLSWAFELTPEGLRRDSRVDHSAPSAIAMAKRLDRLIVVALVLAVGYFAVDKFVFDPARDAALREQAREEGRAEALIGSYGDKSIAVLPFADMSPQRDQGWFSEGIAEELLNLLARVPELRVISRSSAFSIAREDLEIPEIAQRLNVAHVLEGSVRVSGNKIRITAQLIDARTDTHLWSDTYTRELVDVFAIQDEIATRVVRDMEVALLGEAPRAYRTDPEALRLTLQARQLFWAEGSWTDSSHILVEMYEQVLDIDPNYVPALINLRWVLWQLARDPGENAEAHVQRQLQLTVRAASIAPNDPLVLAAIGWDAFEYSGDIETAAENLEKAVELAPSNLNVLVTAAGFAERIGAYDVVLALRERQVSVDPRCFGCLGMLVRAYINVDRLDDAMQTWQEYSRLVPGQRYWTLGMLYLLRGEPAEGLAVFETEGVINDTARDVGRAIMLHDLGRHDEARAALARHVENFGDQNPTGTAAALAWMDDYEAAFELLHKTLEEKGSSEIIRGMNQPHWRKLREHPRWKEIATKIGLDPERVAALDFDPRIP